jgi:hypothetical protein
MAAMVETEPDRTRWLTNPANGGYLLANLETRCVRGPDGQSIRGAGGGVLGKDAAAEPTAGLRVW